MDKTFFLYSIVLCIQKLQFKKFYILCYIFLIACETKLLISHSVIANQQQPQQQQQHYHPNKLNSNNKLNITEPFLVHPEPIDGWKCQCWSSVHAYEMEVQCHCVGQALVRIPQNLDNKVQRLIITQAGITKLRSVGLKVYASSLQDIMLTDNYDFETIEPGALEQVENLRSLYISHSPKLTNLSSEVFTGISSTFRSLHILNCGLIRIPDMRYLSSVAILSMVDLEGNRIALIDEKSVRIKTEQLILDNNPMEYINKYAFFGSQIGKLSLKGNSRLKDIHQSAFAGIVNIQELDLSRTSIETLPTEGLNGLEILRIQKTYTLKTIPSVYHFENLRAAWLTHSFHCCAFKFPSRHDPHRHYQREVYMKELERDCINHGFVTGKASTERIETDFLADWNLANQEEIKLMDIENENNYEDDSWGTSFERVKRYLVASLNNKTKQFYNHFDADKSNNSSDYDLKLYEMENYINPITGAPFANQNGNNDGRGGGGVGGGGSDGGGGGNGGGVSGRNDGLSDTHDTGNNFDFGEFHETTANVYPNSLLNASCGKLAKDKFMVQCYPIPDALNPCEDVMGSQWLRSSVWIVVFLAVFGNVAVLIVLFSNWKDVTVSKFLISNLAFADLCLGLYLLLIASIDVHSMGEYFNFAYDWQYGSGCKAAGFLTIFGSNLSVFTLTVITMERWFAITHAINLNKRINLKTASIIMVCGWTYSVIISALPLFGLSNYSSTSICLPMEADDSFDIAYLVLIVGISGIAFIFIAICYGQIYFSLGKETRHAARHASRGEMTIAKKMALLVIINFTCWAPIAFFGLTAIAGLPLIDVAKSKILLVFFYPLNSCADPYLYAILTAQYRRDLFMLLSKFGFCKKKALKYKMSYSMPRTTQTTCPIPLIGRKSSTLSDQGGGGGCGGGGSGDGCGISGCGSNGGNIGDCGASRKVSHDFIQEEDYV